MSTIISWTIGFAIISGVFLIAINSRNIQSNDLLNLNSGAITEEE
jgi:hypothetical protein